MIIVTERKLNIPRSDLVVGYAGDNLVEIRNFELSRFYGDIDMSLFDFKLDTQVGKVKNIIDLAKVVAEETITLTWTIEESHVLYSGYMAIQVRAFHGEVEKWHSAQEYVLVMPSINPAAAQPDVLPSEFEQMEQRVTAMKNQAQEAAQTATEQANRAQGIADTFSNTTLPVAISAVEAAGQAKVDLAEQQAERVEDIIQEAEQDVLPELRQAIEDGIETKDQLGGSIQEAGEAKTALDGSISSAGTAKGELDGSITEANTAKGQLDDSIDLAGNAKTELDGSITTAEQTKQALDESIATGDLVAFRYDFESHLNDYATYKDSNNLKVAKVEKELNDYKATMQQVNINQEPKQKAAGYGVISLPPNAAEGQVSAIIRGRTLKQELNYNRDTWVEWTSNPSNAITKDSSGLTITQDGTSSIHVYLNDTKYKDNTKYGLLINFVQVENKQIQLVAGAATSLGNTADNTIKTLGNNKIIFTTGTIANNRQHIYISKENTGTWKFRDIRVFELPAGSEIESDFETMTADQLAQKYPYIAGDSVKSTICAMRLKSVSEDESEVSTAYVVAKDEQGKIAELRSLPNGVKDEINVTTGVKTQNVSEDIVVSDTVYDTLDTSTYTNVAVVITTAFADAKAGTTGADGQTHYYNKDGVELTEVAQADIDLEASAGKYYWGEDKKLYIIVAKGTYADIASAKTGLGTTSLNYQMAEPIEIPVQVSGTLTSYPNGTVYIEPYVADAGIYTDKMEVLYSDLPIKALEKISKVDFDTGLETELDITAAVIAEDKLSFTHPDLTSGDIVFFVYEHGAEGTIPETEISYYDSRYVIKGEDDKFYQWEIEAKLVEGVITPSIKLVEV